MKPEIRKIGERWSLRLHQYSFTPQTRQSLHPLVSDEAYEHISAHLSQEDALNRLRKHYTEGRVAK